jgi:hypothetical protein
MGSDDEQSNEDWQMSHVFGSSVVITRHRLGAQATR